MRVIIFAKNRFENIPPRLILTSTIALYYRIAIQRITANLLEILIIRYWHRPKAQSVDIRRRETSPVTKIVIFIKQQPHLANLLNRERLTILIRAR
jgi:hypothetical protein